MANSRYYSSTALQTTLTGGITNSTTTITVGSTTGFPGSLPYTLAIDYGSASEELVEVTGVAGLSLTVTRGIDSTSAQSHSAGAIVRHVSSARDFTDSRTHEAATASVHGVNGNLVGETQVQTLTNKTLTSPTINGAGTTLSGTVTGSGLTLAGTFGGNPTFSGVPNFTGGVLFQRGSATNRAWSSNVSGDTVDRLNVQADGKMLWSSGSLTADTTLYRGAADVLQTDDQLLSQRAAVGNPALGAIVSGDTFDRYRVFADGKTEWGSGAGARDTNLYRDSANSLTTDDALTVVGELKPQSLVRAQRALVTDTQYETRVSGDSVARWFMFSDGKMFWGSGSATADTNLYRASANLLQTDDDFLSHTATASGSTVFTIGSGWTLSSATSRVAAGVCTITVIATRTGGTITASSDGNIADTVVGTLTSSYRPLSATTQWTYDKGGVADGSVSIGTDGICTIKTLSPTATIVNTDNVSFTATFVQ